ncbi:adenine phosphoribosyltransferase [Trypanosoma conorhini]|uniref:adenine phosphoribosyltransferase n=1 Tax=Trypanosoma conorhini TaxID=83891 RepID=A0A422PPY8_9TRYP|nr:adenine phosphoribosyltransferase [Trypanosoma conorhini]RNF19772.1 adenine phosphoribosyltransferase [Trypanosoma conorhini]
MAVVERSPKHLVLSESHPLSKELYANVFGEVLSSKHGTVTQLFDVSSITERPLLFKKVIGFLAERYRAMGKAGPTHILSLESRGYVIGAPLAFELGIPFVLAQVTKRFPSSFVHEDKALTYLPPSFSIRNGSLSKDSRVVIADDFIATGRSLTSVLRLTEEIVGAAVVEAVVVCDVPLLNGVEAVHNSEGARFKKTPIFTLMHFNATQETIHNQLVAHSTQLTCHKL